MHNENQVSTPGRPRSYFARPQRAPHDELEADINLVANNPVIDGLLTSVGGMLLVLNEQRQVVATNELFMKTISQEHIDEILGLRTGELLGCQYAKFMEAGCGTSPWCSSCGAALAIAGAMAHDKPVERKCVMATSGESLCLSVRACPIRFAGRRFILLFLLDISESQRRAQLERAFFNDVEMLAQNLSITARLLDKEVFEKEIVTQVHVLAERLSQEVSLQKSLIPDFCQHCVANDDETTTDAIIDELVNSFAYHPVASGRTLELFPPSGLRSLPSTGLARRVPRRVPALATESIAFRSDVSIVLRILSYMITNAFEATPRGGVVRLGCGLHEGRVEFRVWNSQPIPMEVAGRIFQRHFTTKPGPGRGVGTHAMRKLSQVLDGEIGFDSERVDGTTFWLRLPPPEV